MTPQNPQSIEYRLGELTTAVKNFRDTLEDFDHRLFGNGNEGVIAEHARELVLLKQAFIERNVKQKVYLWAFRVLGGVLVWTWGVLVGASSWIPKLHEFLRSIGW